MLVVVERIEWTPIRAVSALAAMLRRVVTSQTIYFLLGLVLIGLFLARWVESLGGPAELWHRFGLLAPAVSVPIHAVLAVTPLPSDLMGIANGSVYGFWLGTMLSWIGWFLGSFIQYGIGRRLQKDFDLEGWMARSPERLRRFPVEHPVFIIGSRFVPYAGGHLATILPGAMGVKFSRFAWCTAVAIIPSSFVMTAIGAGLLLL